MECNDTDTGRDQTFGVRGGFMNQFRQSRFVIQLLGARHCGKEAPLVRALTNGVISMNLSVWT